MRSVRTGLLALVSFLPCALAVASPFADPTFHQAADLFIHDGAGLSSLQADELKLDAALQAARQSIRDEAKLRHAAAQGASGQDQRLLGEADAARGSLAFQQGEIDRLSMEIDRQSARLVAELARLDDLRTRECKSPGAAQTCGTPAFNAQYTTTRTNTLTAIDHAAAHAKAAKDQVAVMAQARPAGTSIRSSTPGIAR